MASAGYAPSGRRQERVGNSEGKKATEKATEKAKRRQLEEGSRGRKRRNPRSGPGDALSVPNVLNQTSQAGVQRGDRGGSRRTSPSETDPLTDRVTTAERTNESMIDRSQRGLTRRCAEAAPDRKQRRQREETIDDIIQPDTVLQRLRLRGGLRRRGVPARTANFERVWSLPTPVDPGAPGFEARSVPASGKKGRTG